MVTVTGTLNGEHVRAEVHGPHDVRGHTLLISVAVRLINQGHPVYGGILVGGGLASFEHERIAAATLAYVCDEGTVVIEGFDPTVPVGAVA
jgi:hypothetical protein